MRNPAPAPRFVDAAPRTGRWWWSLSGALLVSLAACGNSQDCEPGDTKKETCDGTTHTLRCGLDGTWPVSICGSGKAGDASDGGAAAQLDFAKDSKVVLDKTTGLLWQRKVDTTRRTREEGIAYCIALELTDPVHGTLQDFRLPSRDELESIVLTSTTNPAIDTDAFPDTPSEPFWTFTKHSDQGGFAVDFEGGGTGYQVFSGKFFIRCVQ